MKKIDVIEFIRVSTLEQADDDREGLPRQKNANSRTIKINNLNVIKSIELVDVSGASVDQTPEFHELMQLVKDGTAKGIVVSEWDRLLRMNNFIQLAFLDIFKKYNIKVYTSTRVIDLNEDGSDFLTVFESIFAGKERTRIKKRIHDSKELKRKNGEHPNNHKSLPLGVSYSKERRYEYNDDSYKIKLLFELFVFERIHNYQELGQKTDIHPGNIKNLLMNKTYIGIREYTEKRSDEIIAKRDGRQGDKKKIKRNPDEIISVRIVEVPLIEESIFYQAQELLNNKSNYHKTKSQSKKRFVYRTFLRCGECGEKMYTSSGGDNLKRDYYYCRTINDYFVKRYGPSTCSSGYLKRSEVDSWIDTFVTEKTRENNYILNLVDTKLNENDNQKIDEEIKQFTSVKKSISLKRERLLGLYIDGKFDKEKLDTKGAELDNEVVIINNKLRSLNKRYTYISKEDIEENLTNLAMVLNEYKYWTPEQKRDFIGIQFPEFHIKSSGITSCKINFHNSGNHTDKG